MPEELAARAEAVEAEFMYQYESSAPPSIAAALGITTTRIGGGVALSMRHDPTGYWSKALGFGFDEPVTAGLVDRVLDFYRSEGSVGAVLQIAPSVLPADWADIARRHGLRPGGRIVKLACPIEDFTPAGETALRIEHVGPGDARAWASVVLKGFGMPEEGLAEMLVAVAGHPNWRPFAAWEGDRIVGGASLFLHGEVASLNSGAVLADHRNRGAQSALIAARVREAASAGCRWLVAETGEPAEGVGNPSLNNMLRAGLQRLYTRQSWIWSPGGIS
ncbi:GNAT family N-acetyltransferase [Microbispora sp. RL4-1S]|uniref:GNAT family N-acetyltransferase n=1 Tax=Microbispora oryzae TaxID=2806554 RepID=A0A940WIC2_9ACTN|nr:GNAT family N-acetyltransferase [Microbispora oryzae]MBP2704507.1 GNAT family N-acetyltransferase [Microbispora oryzae]